MNTFSALGREFFYINTSTFFFWKLRDYLVLYAEADMKKIIFLVETIEIVVWVFSQIICN